MSNVLVVSALPEETEYIADYVKSKPQWEQLGEDHFRNVEKDVNIRVKVLGVGKVNAAFGTADGIHEANPDLIVNIGVAGGLADDLDRGSVAIGTDYVQVDLHTLLPENEPEIDPTRKEIVDGLKKIADENGIHSRAGRIATGDFVLFEADKREHIKAEFDPIAFDMESAAVAQVATAKGIDFVSIRSFSDMANTDTIEQLSDKKELDEDEKKLRRDVFRAPAKLIIDYLA